MIQAVMVRIADAKPRCVHILACDNRMALVQDFGVPEGQTNGPTFRIPLTQVYEWHEVHFGLIFDAFMEGQTAALTALWQNAPLWKPAAPAWKPHWTQ